MSTVSSIGNTSTSSAFSGLGGTGLDKDAFLNLLITQMQNQDPTKPMEDREFIAQLAQFSALEQMQQVNQQITALNGRAQWGTAIATLGHTVTAQPEDGEAVKGTVTAITALDGDPAVLIGNTLVSLSDITAVE
jgi:flagellar basal-body rod modification protein FlgD